MCLIAILTGAAACSAPEWSEPSNPTTFPAQGVAKPTTSPTLSLTPIEEILDGTINLSQNRAPSYYGIVPGISTKKDVELLRGTPNVVRKHSTYESLHYFTNKKEYFLLKDGIVQSVTTDATRRPAARGGTLYSTTLDKKFADFITIEPMFGPPTKVLPDLGLAYSVFGYQFFVPMPIQEYREMWGSYPLEIDPFPLMPSVDDKKITPGQTTRAEVGKLLGMPDRIVSENQNSPWLYDVEPDLWGQLRVSFDSNDQVKSISIEGTEKMYTFENAVNQYGEPELVQFIPASQEQPYVNQALLYLKRGLRIIAACSPFQSNCDLVKRNAKVYDKWYFQPMSREDYEKQFPDSTFMEWHGFDE